MPTTMSIASAAPAAPGAAAGLHAGQPRDDKYVEAIEKLTGNKLARREMMDIEVREERPRRDEGGHGGGGRDRGRGARTGRQTSRPPPAGRQISMTMSPPMEPAQAEPVAQAAPRPASPNRRAERPHEQAPPAAPAWRAAGKAAAAERQPHEKRERHSQRHHNEQAAKPEAVDKSQLPAFLFRPVPEEARTAKLTVARATSFGLAFH